LSVTETTRKVCRVSETCPRLPHLQLCYILGPRLHHLVCSCTARSNRLSI
jgi:hypothetical protein